LIKGSVRGRIIFEEDVPPLDRAVIHVYLEDTTYADASAEKLLDLVVPPETQPDGSIAFETPAVTVEDRLRCTVRVWVDVDGNGMVSKSDYVTMESYPVLTQGHPSALTVRVRRIR
jgi:hypothetical protein